jgi:hypothetical protein
MLDPTALSHELLFFALKLKQSFVWIKQTVIGIPLTFDGTFNEYSHSLIS